MLHVRSTHAKQTSTTVAEGRAQSCKLYSAIMTLMTLMLTPKQLLRRVLRRHMHTGSSISDRPMLYANTTVHNTNLH